MLFFYRELSSAMVEVEFEVTVVIVCVLRCFQQHCGALPYRDVIMKSNKGDRGKK